MTHSFDVAVVGGGILGLAHAWAAAKRGLSVALFERGRHAAGASVRNFGMVWPVGQPAGVMHDRAMRSRSLWLQSAADAGVWVEPCGSLHVAHAADEHAVLSEFARLRYHPCEMLSPAVTLQRFPAVRAEGLRGALWSVTELCVDPRQAVARLPHHLAERFGVRLHFGTAVTHVDAPHLRTAAGERFAAARIVVCSGDDFETLFPEAFAGSGIRRCKLQMMRTVPQPGGWRLGAHLAGGLTLCHYAGFAGCPSLTGLRERFRRELPEYVGFGIHVMASQNRFGEVVVGDSHEYDDAVDPFDKPEIDGLILKYLRRLVELPDWTVAARWQGVYAKHPTEPLVTLAPQPGVAVRVAPGGAGMTLAFAFGEEWAAGESGEGEAPASSGARAARQ